ncbi:MAG: hypothetical protein V1888_01585, partial [archaeon]
KRKYGNFILSKSFESQKKELIFRLIAYNVDRKLILSVWVLGFHQSPNPSQPLKINLCSKIHDKTTNSNCSRPRRPRQN